MNYTHDTALYSSHVNFAMTHSDKLVISMMDNSHLACSESHFELEWLLYAANYIIVVHVFVCNILSHKSLICMEDRGHCMHGYSHIIYDIVNIVITRSANTCIRKLTGVK